MTLLQKSPLWKLSRASRNYTYLGLLTGIYYRELTKYMQTNPRETQLRVLHTHCLSLGTIFHLLVLILEKQFKLSRQVNYKKFYTTYNIGLGITLMMLIVHGTLTTIGKDCNTRWITWTAGLGHTILAIGFYFFFDCLSKSIAVSEAIANRKDEVINGKINT